jgi:hypothetical protein|tara:strand:+ start:151 stop:348 length:198 start_codon:yes stop_codon:yes gene_type:complete
METSLLGLNNPWLKSADLLEVRPFSITLSAKAIWEKIINPAKANPAKQDINFVLIVFTPLWILLG